MSVFSALEPGNVWEFFELICSVPHPSGHERALAEALAERGRAKGFVCTLDSCGNLRMDRPAAKGFEHAPAVLMQGHIDMVPQVKPGLKFDFTKDAVQPVVRDGRVYASGTTLGGDDGAGVAIGLSLLFDDSLKTGPLSILCTTGEEVGMLGAFALDPAMLRGDWLLNLDSGGDRGFCAGCAGGGKVDGVFETEPEKAGQGIGVRITVSGLAGGHSGGNIVERRGNALIFLASFLESLPGLHVSAFNGGDVDNAIPSSAAAECVSEIPLEELVSAAEDFTEFLCGTFNAPDDFAIKAEAVPVPETVWNPVIQKRLISAFAHVPDGVFAMDEKFGIPRTSSNFASVHTDGGKVRICLSQRSMFDDERKAATEKISGWFADLNGSLSVRGEYPGWPAKTDSELARAAAKAWKEIVGTDPEFTATHGGLEAGLFTKKNPHLQILAMGPEQFDIHTANESLDIASVGTVQKIVRRILELSGEKSWL